MAKAGSQFSDFEIDLTAKRTGQHLYAIAGLLSRLVKIGRTNHVYRRLCTLRAHCGEPLVVLGWAADCGELEERIHRALAKHNAHHEWFSPIVAAEIASVVEFDLASSAHESSPHFEAWAELVHQDFALLRDQPVLEWKLAELGELAKTKRRGPTPRINYRR